MDLTEAEDIKKRWQEYIEELYKKDLHDLLGCCPSWIQGFPREDGVGDSKDR